MSELKKLETFANVSSGNSAPQDKSLFANGTHAFIRTSDVGAIHVGAIAQSRDFLNDQGIKGLRRFPKGTVLFPKSGASTFLNHRVLLMNDSFVSSHLATIKADNSLCLDKYIYYFLQTIDARSLCQDQSYPSLNRDQIASIQVPLPSLIKQKEIVEKLENIFGELDILYLNQQRALICINEIRETFLSSIFHSNQEIFSKNLYLTIGELCQVGDGNHSSKYPSKNEMVSSGVPFIRAQNMTNGTITEDNMLYISKQKHEVLRKGHLKKGDILFTNRGEIGKTAIVPEAFDGSNLNSQIAWLRCGENLSNTYLYYFLQTKESKHLFDTDKTGTALQQFPISKLKNIKVPIIPLSEQQLLVSKIETLLAGLTEYLNNQKKLGLEIDILKRSIFQSAFEAGSAA